jgi:hypothetical protein
LIFGLEFSLFKDLPGNKKARNGFLRHSFLNNIPDASHIALRRHALNPLKPAQNLV